jgi:Beta-glucosidase (SUN family)
MERGEGVELRSVSSEADIEKRQSQCQFPTDAGLVSVTPDQENAGWAMSPNQPCTPGSYCPYACPPGQLSMQWDPTATSYTYPESMVSYMRP